MCWKDLNVNAGLLLCTVTQDLVIIFISRKALTHRKNTKQNLGSLSMFVISKWKRKVKVKLSETKWNISPLPSTSRQSELTYDKKFFKVDVRAGELVRWKKVMSTFCAESRTGSELGNIHNFDSKLLPCLSVDASPHNTEGTPEKQNQTKEIFSTWFA